MKRISLFIPENFLKALGKLAKKRSTTASQLIRDAIYEFLKAAGALCLLCALMGCGAVDQGSMDIEYHHMSRAEMDQRFGTQYIGYTTWHNTDCDIYMLTEIQYYFHSEDCYEAMLAHEERHCREGNWHVNGDEQSREPECDAAAQYCIEHGVCEGEI